MVTNISALNRTDIWINGGFFALRNEIFRYIRPGDELVREPFQRLIEQAVVVGVQVHRLLAVHGHFQGQAAP
jgi:glucose-1-phosphate cytidylyltransferase